MAQFRVFCFPDDSHNPNYDKPSEFLAELGLTNNGQYGDQIACDLPYQVYSGVVEGESAEKVLENLSVALAAYPSFQFGVDRFHIFVAGPEIAQKLILG